MKTVYLLPVDYQNLHYSLNKEELLQLLAKNKHYPHNEILQVEVEDDVAEFLTTPDNTKTPVPEEIPAEYLEHERKLLTKKMEKELAEDLRIYIVFTKYNRCVWSPSGNNLNSFYDREPEHFLTKAIRVPISKECYVQLYAHFEWACDF